MAFFELSQELVCVLVIVLVCVVLSCICLLLWLVRCRRDHVQHKEDTEDRRLEMDNYQLSVNSTALAHNNKKGTPYNKRKAAQESAKKEGPKRQQSADKDVERNNSQRDKKGSQPRPGETMQQFENRVNEQNGQLESIREEGTPIRNKRVDTVSVTAAEGSMETLERNDSKVNVFPVDKIEEMDLNPGLNSAINLETI